jgi:hypothetical protein
LDEDWPLTERLSNVAADLLSERRFEPFIRRLFAVVPGAWQGVADCCSGLPAPPRFAAEIFAEHTDSFVVTHLQWPGSAEGDSYALVLFVHTEVLWSTIAVYNRAGLDEV